MSAIFYQLFNFSPNENENEKSFLDEIKKKNFILFEGLSFGEK